MKAGPAEHRGLQQAGQLEHGEEFQRRDRSLVTTVGLEILAPETRLGEFQALEVVQEITLLIDPMQQTFEQPAFLMLRGRIQ